MLARLEEQLREALRQTPELAEFAENLLIDQTPEGLRIQLTRIIHAWRPI